MSDTMPGHMLGVRGVNAGQKLWTTPDRVAEPLYVISPIYNPIRYKSRWKLYQRFAKHVMDSGAALLTIEAAFGPDREHAVHEYAPNKALAECDQTAETLPHPELGQGVNCRHDSQWRGRHQYIRVRTLHELWLKENLINVALGYLPHDWKYVAWVDADVLFARPNWVSETLHALQHYKIVQMFSHYQDLGPNYEVLGPPSPGFTAFYNEHGDIPRNWYGYPYPYGRKPGRGAPGLCWAARREALEADTGVGGLLDVNIVGAGDWYMAHGLIGKMERCIFPGITQGYKRHLLEWQRRALARIRKNIGTVEGLALHFFHGRKVQRGYQTRMDILRRNKFNPDLDLARDHQGMLQLIDRGDERSIQLRDDLRRYHRQRNEDSIDVE